MRIGRLVPAAALAAALVACSSGAPPVAVSSPAAPPSQASKSGLPGPLADRLQGFTGVALAVRGSHVLVAGGLGVPGSVPAEPSVRTTVFDIGSIAKSFTAAAVLLLDQRGRLRLNDTVGSFFPGATAATAGIRVAALLDHTSGLPLYASPDTADLTAREAVARILALPVRGAGRFRYSDAGYTLLAAIVQRAAGEPFRRFVDDELLRPAGMRTTGWYGDTPDGATLAHGLVRGRDTGPAGSQASGSWSTLGAGAMVSTAEDLVRWARAVRGRAILSAPERRAMFAPRVPIGSAGGPSAAFGWVVGRTPDGARLIAVGGGTDYGFTSDLRIAPDSDTVTVALSDTSTFPAERAGVELAAAVAG